MEINGHWLHVREYGPVHGPTVVLLHHGLGTTRAWRRQAPALAAAGLHTLVYDRWGYGQSTPRLGLGMPDFKEDQADLLAILDTKGITQAALVGHSDGGTIALQFSADHPGRVWALVTIAAHIYVEANMLPSMLGVRHVFEQDMEFRQKFQDAQGAHWQQVFHNWYDGWQHEEYAHWDMRQVLGKISCPTLVIQGMNDEHATPQHARDIAANIAGAQLWLMPDAGHMLQREKPAELNQRLVAFLLEQRIAPNPGTGRSEES